MEIFKLMNTSEPVNSSCDSSIATESEIPASKRALAAVVVKKTTSKSTQSNERPSSKELASAITAIGPTLLTRYVCHQARVCNQTETDLNHSLEIYLKSLLDSSETESDNSFSVGDLWSGLIWWRDEASWVGRVGVFSLSDVKLMAQEILKSYLLNVERGINQKELQNHRAGA